MSDDKEQKAFPANARARRKPALRVATGVCVLLLATAASTLGYMHYRMNYCITAVLPGRLYRSSEMTPARLAQEASELGIRTVIDLRNPARHRRKEDMSEAEKKIEGERIALEAAGIRHVALRSRQIPANPTVDKFIKEIDAAGAGPVLIHCDHGIGRTGLYIALYLIEYAGYSHEQARACVSRYYSLRPHGRKHFARDYDKGRYIMNYVPRRPQAGSRQD